MPNDNGIGSPKRLAVIRGVLHNLPVFLFILAILVVLLSMIEALNTMAGDLVGAIAYACAVVAALLAYVQATKGLTTASPQQAHSAATDIVRYLLILVWVPFFIVASSQLFRHLSAVYGGFVSSYADYWHWVLFGGFVVC
jgi:hypothetical protein